MTTDSTSISTPKPIPVTIERISLIMKEFGIDLLVADEQGTGSQVASANLNGHHVMLAVIGSVLIVRADRPTEMPVADGNPAWHLACNQVNCFNFAAKAVVVDRTENIVVRAEKDVPIAAGLNDIQLSAMLKNAIDHILAIQDAVAKAGQKIG
ncbi:YbjN domain-containing protein [Corynebacterium crudilactis]|uniref:YbjN domain-containing protein n=1 Tax=Corynebacterium crudilactis TaxID=1652495 RepID=A0A172QTV6_9CORY|nr:YbjN domain-containing protein [Corynebacterium crudilactis]ANE04123.1 hypothetical protein ccrud_07810 [Corynebacterium crudilactis]